MHYRHDEEYINDLFFQTGYVISRHNVKQKYRQKVILVKVIITVATSCRLKIIFSICIVSQTIRCRFFRALSSISKKGFLRSWYIHLNKCGSLFITSRFARSLLILLKQTFNTQTQFMYNISIWNTSRVM